MAKMWELTKWSGTTATPVVSVDDTTGLKVGESGGGLSKLSVFTATVNPASVAANTSAEQTFTVTGVAAGDVVVSATKPSAFTAGCGLTGARVSAANTVALTFMNTSAGAIDEASETWTFVVARAG